MILAGGGQAILDERNFHSAPYAERLIGTPGAAALNSAIREGTINDSLCVHSGAIEAEPNNILTTRQP